MLIVTLLAACAHRTNASAATLDGGWSSGEISVYVLPEEEGSGPDVWLQGVGGAELSPTGSIVRRADGAVQFRPSEGPAATAILLRNEAGGVELLWVDDADGQTAHHPLTRVATPSRAALEQAWVDQAAAVMAWNVEAIRTAELAHFFAFGAFLPAGAWPRPVTALTPEPVDWGEGSDFELLGWTPDGRVRGTFQVTVAEDGHDLTVHGWQDLDGDGIPAHWTATRQVGVTQVSIDGTQ